MAIVQALIAALTRSAGKLLNTVFAWATVLLFGRVSEDQQVYLSAIAFGSVIWLIVLVGVAFPSFATFLLSFVPLPDWIDTTWIRLAMLAAVVILPAAIGAVSVFMVDKADRPRGAATVTMTVLRGYPYTVGLAVTLATMTVFAPILKVRALVKRWTSAHVPVIIESRDYPEVVAATERALEEGGMDMERRPASWMLRAPTKVLTLFARGATANLVADQMTMLRSKELEIVLHPSDLVISGREAVAARARAIIAKQLVFTPAHLTWDKEANELEDRIVAVWKARETADPTGLRDDLRRIERDLDRLEVPYEEWAVLFRELLLVERALRQAGHVSSSMGGAWLKTLSAGLVAAAPHVSRVADALEDTAKEVRKTAETAPHRLSVISLATGVVAVVIAVTRPWRRRAARPRKAA
jgi:hypothetical protein